MAAVHNHDPKTTATCDRTSVRSNFDNRCLLLIRMQVVYVQDAQFQCTHHQAGSIDADAAIAIRKEPSVRVRSAFSPGSSRQMAFREGW